MFACASPSGTTSSSSTTTPAAVPSKPRSSYPRMPRPRRRGGGVDHNVELTPYCPSNKCPEGRATCPNSRFRCEVDLRTDRANCGACGAACPYDTSPRSMNASKGSANSVQETYGDCDGVADNGCETRLGCNDNCNGCGKKCEDPNQAMLTTQGRVRVRLRERPGVLPRHQKVRRSENRRRQLRRLRQRLRSDRRRKTRIHQHVLRVRRRQM